MTKSGLHLHIDVIKGDLDKLPYAVSRAVSRSIEYTALDVWGNITRESPVKHGRLQGSFQLSQEGLGWRIWTDVHYALAVHEGTGPRMIYPKDKQALYWPGADHPVKSVSHPGTKANPYVTRSIDRTGQRVEEFVRRAIEEEVGS